MSENWDEHAANWDRDERVRFYADQAFLSLIEHVDGRDNEWRSKRVLDFGCGTGLLSEKLAPLVGEVVAVDTSLNMIDVVRQKKIPNVTPICAGIGDADVASSAAWFSEFDLIVASSVCSFLPSYESTMGVLAQALTSTGYFVQWDWLSSGDDEFGLTSDRVSSAFREAGLKCVYVGSAFSVPFDDGTMPVLMGVAAAASAGPENLNVNGSAAERRS